MQKYDYFEKNRYDFSDSIRQIEKKESLDEVIYYEDEYYEIEIYISKQVNKTDVIGLLKNLVNWIIKFKLNVRKILY